MIQRVCKYCGSVVRTGSYNCGFSPTGLHVIETAVYVPDPEPLPPNPSRDRRSIVIWGIVGAIIAGVFLERAYPVLLYAWIPCALVTGIVFYVFRRALVKIIPFLLSVGVVVIVLYIGIVANPDLGDLLKKVWDAIYNILFRR